MCHPLYTIEIIFMYFQDHPFLPFIKSVDQTVINEEEIKQYGNHIVKITTQKVKSYDSIGSNCPGISGTFVSPVPDPGRPCYCPGCWLGSTMTIVMLTQK